MGGIGIYLAAVFIAACGLMDSLLGHSVESAIEMVGMFILLALANINDAIRERR